MTFNLNGTLLPDDCLSQLRGAAHAGRTVFQKVIPGGPDRCHNCGGTGYLWFQFVTGGPFRQPDARGKVISTHHDGAWWTVESRMFACPVCNADQPSRIALLWQSSGLLPEEQAWRPEHLARMPGKEDAVAAVHGLLAELPRPTGWVTFHGPYGRGKSGLLKSAVAACVRAGVAGRYVRSADILAEIGATYGGRADRDDRSELEVLSQYDDWPLLAVDEVDRISGTDWAQSKLMGLLDRRYNQRGTHATLLATNQAPESMGPRWGYLMSRMRDGERIPVGGADLRGRVAEPELPEWVHA